VELDEEEEEETGSYTVKKKWWGTRVSFQLASILHEISVEITWKYVRFQVRFTLDILSTDRLSFQLDSILHETSVEITWKLTLTLKAKKSEERRIFPIQN
jgi:hypothetical protein